MEISPRTALIVVDVQKGFTFKPYCDMVVFPDLPTVVKNIHSTIVAFRAASLPVVHIHHASLEDSPLNPTLFPEGFKPMPEALPVGEEVIFVKNVNSGFIGTGLEAHLRHEKIDTLVILGLTTSHCVSTTTRMAGNLGWTVYVPRDGTAMFERPAAPGNAKHSYDAETMHEVALAELHEEFATVVDTTAIVAALNEYEQKV